MDIVLKRVLSLIPKKENGDFKHGALAGFARSIGFKDGHIISDWISGNSESYKNYLYQIAATYNVSVEWLKGETDQKENPTGEAGEVKKLLTRDKYRDFLKELSMEDLIALNADLADEMRGRGKK